MAYLSNITYKHFETPVSSLGDLPAPVAGVIQLKDNTTYRFQGLVNIDNNTIRCGVSNTLIGFDKSDDGIIYTGTSSAIEVTNQSITVSNILINIIDASGQGFSITNSTSFSSQIRECIISGAGKAGTINGGNLVAINNNIHASGYGWDIYGTVNKLGIAINYFENGNSTEHIHLETGTFNIVKIIDNDFTTNSPNVAISIDNDVVVSVLGGGSITGNTFNGSGQYISGISEVSLDWIIENNGRRVLNTSDTVTQRKVRSEEELDLFLALPDPTKYSYLLDAEEFVLTSPIVVPGSGTNGGLTFFGLGNNFTRLTTSTPSINMFEGGGNLFLNDMIVSCEGTNSKVFGISNRI